MAGQEPAAQPHRTAATRQGRGLGGRLSTKARAPRARARSAWCCWSPWRWSAPPPACSISSRVYAGTYILALLALLGTIGVFALFAMASGIMQLASRGQGNPLLKAVVDNAFDGIVVTDQSGRVFYANATYLDLIGATDNNDVRPIERVFIGDPDVSEAIYRLLKAAREGRRLQEEVRIPGATRRPRAGCACACARSATSKHDARMTVWSIADVTRDRERQENVFQELQHAIDYLDHAPAGFFSVDAAGDIVYLNATLPTWLDHDLAQVGAGSLKLADIVAGEGAALLTTLNAAPGEVKTEVLDLDLKTRGGKPVPVRLFHKVAFGADGAPGASRTLVLNRARDDGSDPQRAAEVRFMRFFQNTPMAIATVDKTGRIARSNARFASAFEGMLKRRRALDPFGGGRARPRRRWKPRSARRARARATSRRSKPRSPAAASAGRASSSPRSRRRIATARRPSSMRSRPPRSARWRTGSTSSRRWSRSASSPAASRTTSTTCCRPS